MRLAKSATRIYSQVKKEILQIIRRPATFLGLVLGPFAILALLGFGYTGVRPAVETVLVIPPDLTISRDVAFYQDLAGPAVHVLRIDEDPTAAREQLGRQELGLVVVAPAEGVQAVREGRRAQIEIDYNEVDPTLRAYIGFLAQGFTSELNRQILTQVAAGGEDWILQGADPGTSLSIPPEVIAAPTEAVALNLAPTQPGVLAFFVPAVLALVLQHMAVTLSALSFVREREAGALELFRVSPVNSFELLLGRVIGFGLVAAIMAVAVTAGAVSIANVPVLADPVLIAGVIAMLVFASLMLGLFVSVISSTERQAVQLSLLLLLASVFFSGFVLPISDFGPVVQSVAYTLPVTHAIQLLQDLMLRGTTITPWHYTALAVTIVALVLATTLLLRRLMSKG
ncbi:MAG: ABC transporter permease [Candidatus Limnocylindrales bacterium]